MCQVLLYRIIGWSCVNCSFSHAPRERVSWNAMPAFAVVFWCGHAPRERVSWNCQERKCSWCSGVTLHVSVWVEICFQRGRIDSVLVTLHVSVWVEIDFCSVNSVVLRVTLHVSVWVEMISVSVISAVYSVTLHVSVWVEIQPWISPCAFILSRSTWACELKWPIQPTDRWT